MSMIAEPLPGNNVILERLRSLTARAADLTPYFTAITASFRSSEMQRFDQEGPGWAPLKQSTIERKLRAGSGTPYTILERFGGLRGSLTGMGAGGFVRMTAIGDDQMLYIGTAILDDYGSTYANRHQGGTKYMPARPVVAIKDTTVEGWAASLREYLAGGTTSNMLGYASEGG